MDPDRRLDIQALAPQDSLQSVEVSGLGGVKWDGVSGEGSSEGVGEGALGVFSGSLKGNCPPSPPHSHTSNEQLECQMSWDGPRQF